MPAGESDIEHELPQDEADLQHMTQSRSTIMFVLWSLLISRTPSVLSARCSPRWTRRYRLLASASAAQAR